MVRIKDTPDENSEVNLVSKIRPLATLVLPIQLHLEISRMKMLQGPTHDLQKSAWPLGNAVAAFTMLRGIQYMEEN
jgi:hypothetical protein